MTHNINCLSCGVLVHEDADGDPPSDWVTLHTAFDTLYMCATCHLNAINQYVKASTEKIVKRQVMQ